MTGCYASQVIGWEDRLEMTCNASSGALKPIVLYIPYLGQC